MALSVCRLCSKSENILINIFNDITDDVFLAKKILLCFGVHIREEDPITKNICKSCYFFTSTAYEHRVTSLQNDAKLWKEYKNSHPDTVFQHPDIKSAPITNSYLPKDISQDDFLHVLNLSHITKSTDEENTSIIHDSVKKIIYKYPTLKLDNAYQHLNLDPVVTLNRKDCYYDCNQVVKSNFGIWSVNNDLGNETSILLQRVKRIPKPKKTDYSTTAVHVVPNKIQKRVVSSKIKQCCETSLVSTTTSNISVEQPNGVKKSPKKHSNKRVFRLSTVKKRAKPKKNPKKGSATKNSAIAVNVGEQDLKRKDGHADLKNIELEVKRRKLVVELPKVDESEFSHMYEEALKHSVKQLDDAETTDTDEPIRSDALLSQSDNLLISFGTPQEAFICQTCNKIFDTLPLLKNHKRFNHKSPSLRCNHCSKRFTLVETLMKHLESHSQKKNKTATSHKELLASDVTSAQSVTNSKYTLRSVAKKSTGGILDFLRSNTFSDSNMVLSEENVASSTINQSEISETKVVAENSEVMESTVSSEECVKLTASESGSTEIVPAMRIVARKSTGGVNSTIRISASSDEDSDAEDNANLTNSDPTVIVPAMNIVARKSTGGVNRNSRNSRSSVEDSAPTDENIEKPNSGPMLLEMVPAIRMLARKSTGGVIKPPRNLERLGMKLVISSDDDDDDDDDAGNVVELLGDADIETNQEKPAIEDVSWKTNETFNANVNVFDLALQPQLPDKEEQESIENTEQILVNENAKESENIQTIQVIDDSDAEEDVIFVPNELSVPLNDPARNSLEDTLNCTTATTEICASSVASTSNQIPSSFADKTASVVSTVENVQQSNEESSTSSGQASKTGTRNTKIINETDFINYIFNKCNYNNTVKDIANEKWVLKGMKKIIDQGPVPIIMHNSSDEHMDIQYKRAQKPKTKQPIIDAPWKDIKAIDIPKRAAGSPFPNPYKKIKLVIKELNLNQSNIPTSQPSQSNARQQTSTIQSSSNATQYHQHRIIDKSQPSTSRFGLAQKPILLRLPKLNSNPQTPLPNVNEPNSDQNILTKPNSNSVATQYPMKPRPSNSNGSNFIKPTHATQIPTSGAPTATKLLMVPKSSQQQQIRSRPILSKPNIVQPIATQRDQSVVVPNISSIPPVDMMSKATPNQQTSSKIATSNDSGVLQSNANNNIIGKLQHSNFSALMQNRILTLMTAKRMESLNSNPSTTTNSTFINFNQQHPGQVAFRSEPNVIQTYGNHVTGQSSNLLPTSTANSTSVIMSANSNQQMYGAVANITDMSQMSTHHLPDMATLTSLDISRNPNQQITGQVVNLNRPHVNQMYDKQHKTGSTDALPVMGICKRGRPSKDETAGRIHSNINQTNGNHFITSHPQVPTRVNQTEPVLTTNYNQHTSRQLDTLNAPNAIQTYGIQHITGITNLLPLTTNTSHLVMPRNPNQHNSGQTTIPNKPNILRTYSKQSKVTNNCLPTTTNSTQLIMPTNVNQQVSEQVCERIHESTIIQTNTNQQGSTAQNSSQIVMLSQFHQQSVGLLTVQEFQTPEVASSVITQHDTSLPSTSSANNTITNIPRTAVAPVETQTSAPLDHDSEKKPSIRIKSLTEINNTSADVSRYQLHSTYVETLTKYVTENPNTVNETCSSNANEYLQIS